MPEQPYTVESVEKRLHAVNNAYCNFKVLLEILDEDPEFFRSGDGMACLANIRSKHLEALREELVFLRALLPASE